MDKPEIKRKHYTCPNCGAVMRTTALWHEIYKIKYSLCCMSCGHFKTIEVEKFTDFFEIKP
jgi:transcription elongation factor Elf1